MYTVENKNKSKNKQLYYSHYKNKIKSIIHINNEPSVNKAKKCRKSSKMLKEINSVFQRLQILIFCTAMHNKEQETSPATGHCSIENLSFSSLTFGLTYYM